MFKLLLLALLVFGIIFGFFRPISSYHHCSNLDIYVSGPPTVKRYHILLGQKTAYEAATENSGGLTCNEVDKLFL